MNKTKMILAVTGGVIVLAVLVMGYFAWSSYAAKMAAIEGDDAEGVDGLETVVSKAQTLSHKPVYPCAASVTAIEANGAKVAEWQAEAQKLAARGDKVYEKTTPAAFKTFIVADAKRLAGLPGTVGGVLVKPEFAFGPFKDYIAEGKMPADSQLAELQRRWDDVATVVEMLAASGIAELTDVQFGAEPEKKQETDRNQKQKAKGKKAKDTEVKGTSAYSYVFTFASRPTGLVKAINALETSERFVTVDGYTFSRGKDVIAEALGGDEKKNEEAQGGGGRRGRRGRRQAVVEQEKEEEKSSKNGIVTDPLLDEPMTVIMTVTVHDFRSLEDKGEEKGASK